MAVGKRNERVGTRAGKRAHQKHHDPSQKPQRVRSRQQVAAEMAALDARIERGRIETAEALERQRLEAEEASRQAVLQWQDEQRQRRANELAAALVQAQRAEAEAARKRENWTLGQARALIRQGYSIEQAHRLTGWEERWLEP